MTSELSLSGYSLAKRLHVGSRGEVYLGHRDSDGKNVVIKLYAQNDQGKRAAQREFDALGAVRSAKVPTALSLQLDRELPALVLSELPGIPLARWAQQAPHPVSAFLDVAIQIAECVVAVHDARWLHRDLSPRNVLVEPQSLEVHLIDFGLAVPLSAGIGSSDTSLGKGMLSGTLPFIAPEQTGRMNRGCDFRSDLYTLGATLYYSVVGHPPFQITDPLELIHAHLAQRPTPVRELRSQFPVVLSDLIQKLLEKEPDSRYSTAHALLADLRALKQALERDGRLPSEFSLGGADERTRITFQDRLHGRGATLRALEAELERAKCGRASAVLVRGDAGSGKSSVARIFHRDLDEGKSLFAVGSGTTDARVPYQVWKQIVESLTQQMLVEGNQRSEEWGQQLRKALGNIAGSLLALVPDLSFIVGELPPLPALGPREFQVRLSLALRRFLLACSRPSHPLIVLFDDLHSADAESQAVLADLICETSLNFLLVVTCGSTAGALPPAADAFNDLLTARGATPKWITLEPLSIDDSTELLRSALHTDAESARDLAELIEMKTGNQPLLVRQFVEHLHQSGLLRYKDEQGFHWEVSAIASAPIPESAVGLVTAKIDRLEAAPQRVLEVASCIHTQIDVEFLASVARMSRSETDESLDTLYRQGLLVATPVGPGFPHERVRESAQARLSHEELERCHLEIGVRLLEETPKELRPARAAIIVDQFDHHLENVPGELRIELLELALTAAKQAVETGAAASAEPYLVSARRLLRPEDSEQHPGITFQLGLLGSECAFQAKRFDEALAHLAPFEERSLSVIERVQVAAKHIQVLSFSEPPKVCVAYVLDVLRQFGVRWPRSPSYLRAWLAIFYLHLRIRRKDAQTVLQPAAKVDPRWLAPMLLLAPAGAALLRTDAHLVILASSLALRRYLRYGYVSRPGFTLATHSYLSYQILRDADYARHCVALMTEFNARAPDPVYNLRAELLTCGALAPMLERRRRALAPLVGVAEQALELGDLEFSSYARFLREYFRSLAGDSVDESVARLSDLEDWVLRSGHSYPEVKASRRVVQLLQDTSGDLEEESRKDDAWLRSDGEMPYVRTLWLMVLCVHKRFDLALDHSNALGRQLYRLSPFVHIVDHTFYRGLASAAMAHDWRGRKQRRAHRRELERAHRAVSRWAQNGPDFVHMAQLLEAEILRLKGHSKAALAALERAARRARQQEFPHHAAIAFERAADLLLSERRDTDAEAPIENARRLYASWGAASKLRAMTQEAHYR